VGERKTLTLVPKSGLGLVTARDQHNLGEGFDLSFSGYRDVIVRNGVWRARLGDNQQPAVAGSGAIWSWFFFNSYDTTATKPTTAHLYVAGPLAGPVGLNYWIIGGSNGGIATVNSPYELCYLAMRNRCFIAGMNNQPRVFHAFPSPTSYFWGVNAPTADLSYTPYSNAINANIKLYWKAADINNAGGSINVWTSTGNNFDNSGAWNGKTILIEGVYYTINTVTTTASLTTTTVGPVGAIVNKDFKVFYGNLSWTTTPPKYAYAYYSPLTGHISNPSPVLTLTEQNLSTANVELLGIEGTNDPIYTRIVIFRTASDGGDLFPLKLDTGHGGTATVNGTDFMIENTFTGTKTYRDGQPDTKLGAILGAHSPSFLNTPPPASMRYIAYWDGRVWFVDSTRPWELGFTASPTQINFLGVPEESFPAGNRLAASAEDGGITFLHVIGSSLLVGTNKRAYTVSGSAEGNYRLVKISSRAVDVGHWAIDEQPGETTDETAAAIYIGNDRRLWRQRPGGSFDDLAAPIQDKLDNAPLDASRPFLVTVGQIEKMRICALGIINAAKTAYSFYFYDIDANQWYDWGYGDTAVNPGWSIAYGVSYPSGVGLLLWGKNAGVIFNTFGESQVVGNPTPSLMDSQLLDVGDIEAKKTLQDVILYVDDASQAFTVKAGYDGAAALQTIPIKSLANSPRYSGAGVLHFVPQSSDGQAGKQWHGLKLQFGIPSNASSLLHFISKVKVIYTLESTGISGSP
jgi:hypothetical protein